MEKRDRPDVGKALEITPEMVSAGVKAASLYGHEDDLSEIVIAVLCAALPLWRYYTWDTQVAGQVLIEH